MGVVEWGFWVPVDLAESAIPLALASDRSLYAVLSSIESEELCCVGMSRMWWFGVARDGWMCSSMIHLI